MKSVSSEHNIRSLVEHPIKKCGSCIILLKKKKRVLVMSLNEDIYTEYVEQQKDSLELNETQVFKEGWEGNRLS